jgi:DNA-binding transcriptional ArsR family regulator
MLPARDERRMREILEVLCEPTRVKIVRALRGTTLAAGDLATVIERSRAATSQHLKVLRGVGAVVRRREGNVVRYSLSDDVTAEILEEAADAFDRLGAASGEGG